MAQITVHKNIFKMLSSLPATVQAKIPDILTTFQKDPYSTSLHLHSLKESMLDPKVHGIDFPNGYRGIVIKPEHGENFLLVYIDKHDVAYNWAKNKRFDVHEKTGSFQILDLKDIEIQKETLLSDSKQKYENKPKYILDNLSDNELFTAGIPKPLIPAIRSVKSDEELLSLVEYMPTECKQVLIALSSGMTVDEAIYEILGKDESKTEIVKDFPEINNPLNSDLILFDNEEEFKKILLASMEEWRVFLHPYQKNIVKKEMNGPMLINGAAGTGKTVCLIHRAIHLANKYKSDYPKILFTTFTGNLAIAIRHSIKKLNPELEKNIEIISLYNLARSICSSNQLHKAVLEPTEQESIWNNIIPNADNSYLPLTLEEIKKEYRVIVDSNGIDSEEAYLTVARTGQKPLKREDRKKLWAVFNHFQLELKNRNKFTPDGIIHEARLLVENQKYKSFTHILVDEIQDFSLESIRLVAALNKNSIGKTDTLTLAGDGNQRIYQKHFPLSRGGIETRGRSYRLKINYRTSEQIRKYADSILSGLDISDFEGDKVKQLGEQSYLSGPAPIIAHVKDSKSESIQIGKWVEELLKVHKFLAHEICITPYKKDIVQELTKKNISHIELKSKEDDPEDKIEGIRFGSMERIKGLEFRVIILACSEVSSLTDNPEILERAKYYVAATRARELLYLTLA